MSANMIETPKKLLPASELRRLRIGSYEERIEEVGRALDSFYGPGAFDIVATREDCAVVHTAEGYHRVGVEDGTCRVIQELDVRDYESASTYSLVEEAAGRVAEKVIQGDIRSAVELLDGVMGSVAALPAVAPGVDFEVVRLEGYLKRPALWRRLLRSRREGFEVFLGEELQELQEGRLISDFSKLYDGAVGSANLYECEDEVETRLAAVGERLRALQAEVVEALKTAEYELREEQTEGGPVEALLAFMRDLRDDLREVRWRGEDALVTVDGVRSRGKLCDVLVEELHDREVAGRFSAVAARRLSEAG